MAGAALGVLVLIYLFFPVAYAFPLRMAFGRTVFDKPVIRAFFWPDTYLGNRIEFYQRLLDWQFDVAGYRNLD